MCTVDWEQNEAVTKLLSGFGFYIWLHFALTSPFYAADRDLEIKMQKGEGKGW